MRHLGRAYVKRAVGKIQMPSGDRMQALKKANLIDLTGLESRQAELRTAGMSR
jgi:hypothetical protein